MSEQRPLKFWPGEPADLWPAPEPKVRHEEQPDAKRMDAVRSGIRIEHAVSRRLGVKLAEFVRRPWAPHQRWRAMLLVGPARSGRSWLVSRWLPREKYPVNRSVIHAHLPVDLSSGDILRAILDANRDYDPSDLKGQAMRHAALEELRKATVLVFDGCDHLADLPKPRLWRALARLKSMTESRRVPMILVVSPPILEAISDKPDWAPRFETLHLPKWRVNEDFLALLTSFEDQLPLEKVSRLADRELALHLYALCDGSIARLSEVLGEATLTAIENGTERITIRLLDAMGFTPPQSFRGFLF